MKQYTVFIKGTTPYMQHRMDDEKLYDKEKNRKFIIERDDVAIEDALRAEFHCYRNKDGKCFLPSEHLRIAMINAGSYVKAKVGNARKSMKNVVAAMFLVTPDEILLPQYDTIDKRSAVNRNVKARIIVIRPKWTDWGVSFTLGVDNFSITKETIQEILNNAGQYVGIGSYRPTNNGFFGRFEVENIKEL